jgi:hypothetical protein
MASVFAGLANSQRRAAAQPMPAGLRKSGADGSQPTCILLAAEPSNLSATSSSCPVFKLSSATLPAAEQTTAATACHKAGDMDQRKPKTKQYNTHMTYSILPSRTHIGQTTHYQRAVLPK